MDVHNDLMRTLVMCSRDAEVLSLLAVIINKLRMLMESEVPRVFDAVFEVTLQVRVLVTVSCAAAAASIG
eukprot:scaffold84683_cov18-Tisochrysis_lutea.AAC.2